MSVRGAEGEGVRGPVGAGGEGGERRAGGAPRVHFEALVSVGEASSGAGFEAESIDVSPDGMRLRTAYVPQVGERLVCRFDGAGGELALEGEVCWRNEEARGGEFGLRFEGLDAAAEEAVRAMCASMGAPAAASEAPPAPAGAARGSRVRLHIDGLGSPMKARVRDGGQDEIEVGSNLEFLKVGRTLQLEDVDQGERREAYIDQVKVEVDPSTSVPQLVVTLRYEAAAPRAARARPKGAAAATVVGGGATVVGGGATVVGGGGVAASGLERRAVDEDDLSPALSAEAPEAVEADGSPSPGEASEGAPEGSAGAKLRLAGDKAAQVGRAMAGKLGPALAGVGARAAGAMAGIAARMREKRAERAAAEGEGASSKKGSGPRRMTAPPPGGALKSEGRRLVREEAEDSGDESPAERQPVNRKAAAMGSFLGLAAVLVIFGATRLMGLHGGSRGSTESRVQAAALLPAAAVAGDEAAAPGGGTLNANVPLFGATPLSTTEPVPSPAPPDPAVAAEDAAGDADGEPSLGDSEQTNPREWGQGVVKNPVVLKIKADGPIEQLSGAAGAMGFTVSLPERRALSSGTGLARKDKRIAAVRVVNTPHGAEVTLQFKDGVPAYLAKAHGNRLEIALGSEEAPKKVASKSSSSAKPAKKAKADGAKGKASAKKNAKSKKKPQ